MSVWAYRGQHPEAHTIANDYCTTISRGHNKAVAAAHDFSQLRTVMVLHDWHDDQSEGAPANERQVSEAARDLFFGGCATISIRHSR